MSNTSLIQLPKWPGMLVLGEDVTRRQAAEIIFKTEMCLPSFLSSACNDHQYNKELCKLFDIPYPSTNDREEWHNEWTKLYNLSKQLSKLPLDYLNNNRIASSWIGGVFGWCNWNGRIECNNYNIGKWPHVEEVEKEWKLIATAFPFLTLGCQLLNHEIGSTASETSSDKPGVVVEFLIKDGTVRTLPRVPGSDLSLLDYKPLTDKEWEHRFITKNEWTLSPRELKIKLEEVYGKDYPKYE